MCGSHHQRDFLSTRDDRHRITNNYIQSYKPKQQLIHELAPNENLISEINNELLSKEMIETINTQGHNNLNILNGGTYLFEIIKKAKIVSENYKTNEKVSNLNRNLCIAAGLIVFIHILLFLAWKKNSNLGSPIFLCFRLFLGLTGRNQEQNQGVSDDPNVR